MKSKQIMFFAILEDIEPIFQEFEHTLDISYYLAGLHNDSKVFVANTIFEIPNLGVAAFGDWNQIDRYLILKRKEILNIREIVQKGGNIKYAIDQMNNPKSIELKVGGIYLQKEKVIVAGRVATISNDSDSIELFKLLSTKIKKYFKKIDSFYVGPMAETKLKEGWRLVTNERASSDYDLTLK